MSRWSNCTFTGLSVKPFKGSNLASLFVAHILNKWSSNRHTASSRVQWASVIMTFSSKLSQQSTFIPPYVIMIVTWPIFCSWSCFSATLNSLIHITLFFGGLATNTDVRVCLKRSSFTLQQLNMDVKLPSVITLILMTSKVEFSPPWLRSTSAPAFERIKKKKRKEKETLRGGPQLWLADNCSALCRDWLVGGCWQSDRLATVQEFRLFRGCDVCCCCCCFGPTESAVSPSHFLCPDNEGDGRGPLRGPEGAEVR